MNMPQKDDRIVTIHKQNGGTSDARNVGLEKASGDYITFMDNDDYWSNPDALCDIIKVISETEPDVVMHANMVYWQDKNKTVNPSSFDRTLVSGKKRRISIHYCTVIRICIHKFPVFCVQRPHKERLIYSIINI